MTKFDELQQAHQSLLDRVSEVTDKSAFVPEVQAYVTRVCDEAVDVPNSRDRDQLRANLRFWASYIFDATGTYPVTTMRPPRLPEQTRPPTPTPPRPAPVMWIILAVVAVVALLALIASLRLTEQTGTKRPVDAGAALDVTSIATPIPLIGPSTPPQIEAYLLTQGPSPFDPQVWVAKILLNATGGNGEYVFWIDGERYPTDEYTLEASGCASVTIQVGVTSAGQSALGAISVQPSPELCGP